MIVEALKFIWSNMAWRISTGREDYIFLLAVSENFASGPCRVAAAGKERIPEFTPVLPNSLPRFGPSVTVFFNSIQFNSRQR